MELMTLAGKIALALYRSKEPIYTWELQTQIPMSSLYSTISKMKKAGLITTTQAPANRKAGGGRPREYLHLTPKAIEEVKLILELI
jgi:DNA-binding PadR family transcriptional regulator